MYLMYKTNKIMVDTVNHNEMVAFKVNTGPYFARLSYLTHESKLRNCIIVLLLATRYH